MTAWIYIRAAILNLQIILYSIIDAFSSFQAKRKKRKNYGYFLAKYGELNFVFAGCPSLFLAFIFNGFNPNILSYV